MTQTHPSTGATGTPPEYGVNVTLEEAKAIAHAAEEKARQNGWPMVFAIVDTGAHLVLLHKMDQAQIGSVTIARLKAETAAKFRKPTKLFEDVIAGGGLGLRMLTAEGIIALEGGLPIMHEGKVIGAIGVSGMQSSQDAEVARAGLAALR
jgi:uncharacterized protein GlcG (DUF336 family)